MDSILAAHIPRPSEPKELIFGLSVSVHFQRQTDAERRRTLSAVKSGIYGALRNFQEGYESCFFEKITLGVAQRCRISSKDHYR
jgi:hypothetical protein